MDKSIPIINPMKGKKSPDPGDLAIIVSAQNEMDALCAFLGLSKRESLFLLMSRLYSGKGIDQTFSLAGPAIGSAYTTILVETLIGWGARKIIFFGTCGAVSENVKIGDIIIPTCALIDEGVSKHYNGQWKRSSANWPENYENEEALSYPADNLTATLKNRLSKNSLNFKEGMIWTTDAVFMETHEKVEYFQKRGVLGVEMETSALFTVCKHRGVETGAMLVVSDELSDYTWRHGFGNAHYKKSLKNIIESLGALCKKI